MPRYTLKFWNENRWNTFDSVGDVDIGVYRRIGIKLALLFDHVELWIEDERPLRTSVTRLDTKQGTSCGMFREKI